ncbi:helix-turn-helix domain-containing protein [Mycobacterium sp. 1164985.4]|uniref:PucR family transcriptional regulator n=1 Tax=Mycobacterium sp. 1164985.4 TaxID=1834069 RepID=UPI000800988C|nr:helix-turn-helix domain-containing protein [Mycobacterium sp. 1164985.4]OBK78397.1 PucR family transcriptional regulator [Mycobacterium sp. 1164985.4]
MGARARHDETAVREAAAVVMERLIGRQSEVSLAIEQRLVAEIEELKGDSGLVELLNASTGSNIGAVFHALRYEIPLENFAMPTAAMEYARRLAQRGVPMNALVRAYRLGHGLVLRAAVEEIKDTGFDTSLGFAVLERISAATFVYIDWISQQVVATYERERDNWLKNRDSLRAMRVREVLEATDVDVDAVTSAIRYPLRRRHLGLVLWLPAETDGDELIRLERFLSELGESLATQGSPLFVAEDKVSGWGWIPLESTATPTVVADIRSFVANYASPPSVAVGSPAAGVEGFQRTHRQAQRARNVAVAAGPDAMPVTSVADPGLYAGSLLCDNLDEVREWVHEILGPLSSATDNDARLRETLRTFLRAGASYKAAADELNLHFNSVKYRIQRAVERRGAPIDDASRLDVELALLVCHWFGGSILQSKP